jgi:hypothetical protein
MASTNKPNKQAVRDYMDSRTHEEDPPPTLEEIRRQLGWHLVQGGWPMPEVPD